MSVYIPRRGEPSFPNSQRVADAPIGLPAPSKESNAIFLSGNANRHAVQLHCPIRTLAEGGFQVHVPAISEIVTYGRTREEALRMAEDAIRCVLESARQTGEPIPEDCEPVSERLAAIVI
jgi:predicted RNase H-like HicB family nuclease